MSFFLEKFEWKSHFSRREREFFFINLVFRDENGNSFLSISCFETRTRNRKWFLKVEREKIKLILTGIPGNGNSRHSLLWDISKFFYSVSYISHRVKVWDISDFLVCKALLMTLQLLQVLQLSQILQVKLALREAFIQEKR